MTLDQAVATQVRELSEADQQKVLDFIQSLHAAPRRVDPRGLYAARGVHVGDESIAEARREAWANFPRDPNATTDAGSRP